jgi:prolipoprotein diacylglyceryltransferase
MYPVLFKFGPIVIHTWGVMLAISAVFGIWVSSRRAARRMLVPEYVSDITLKGFEFYLLIILYAADRFIIDFTRSYTPDEKLGIFSHNQIICIVLFAVFGAVLLKNIHAKGVINA